MSVSKINSLSKSEILSKIESERKKLFELKMEKRKKDFKGNHKFPQFRKEIARLFTLLNKRK